MFSLLRFSCKYFLFFNFSTKVVQKFVLARREPILKGEV